MREQKARAETRDRCGDDFDEAGQSAPVPLPLTPTLSP
jgi:hypothetical protein